MDSLQVMVKVRVNECSRWAREAGLKVVEAADGLIAFARDREEAEFWAYVNKRAAECQCLKAIVG